MTLDPESHDFDPDGLPPKPTVSRSSWLAGFIVWTILATILGGLAFSYGPLLFVNSGHDHNHDLQMRQLNWIALHFKQLFILGIIVGAIAGIWSWLRITRK